MNGFLLLNKPVGLTSAACVARVKKMLALSKGTKIGHTGTLDPFAEGLLPMAIGKATKSIPQLPKTRKVYRAQLKLGEETDTLDTEGEVVRRQAVPPVETSAISKVMHAFIGERTQLPPLYSAVKYKGKPLYHYARQGKADVPRLPRWIAIHRLELIEWTSPYLTFEVVCSGGTYVRVLGQELAVALGTVGHLVRLIRLESDGFSLEQAVTLEALTALPVRENAILPLEDVLATLPLNALSSILNSR